MLTITDTSTLTLRAEVDETDVLLVRKGVKADVELDAVPGARVPRRGAQRRSLADHVQPRGSELCRPPRPGWGNPRRRLAGAAAASRDVGGGLAAGPDVRGRRRGPGWRGLPRR